MFPQTGESEPEKYHIKDILRGKKIGVNFVVNLNKHLLYTNPKNMNVKFMEIKNQNTS